MQQLFMVLKKGFIKPKENFMERSFERCAIFLPQNEKLSKNDKFLLTNNNLYGNIWI